MTDKIISSSDVEISIISKFVDIRLHPSSQKVFYTEIKDCCVEDALFYAVMNEMELTVTPRTE